ncbi:hypothetical protein DPEC_G00255290 [Dallia pectoralis]|uniref:Uncharacterized protein n=1 Tax=Dallia pectoralis TaxID=75939 RepID=A0ACC2FUH6_DALPE|nr:hypothetical protein DPEC_G00255290 [Dallia pectoralis]
MLFSLSLVTDSDYEEIYREPSPSLSREKRNGRMRLSLMYPSALKSNRLSDYSSHAVRSAVLFGLLRVITVGLPVLTRGRQFKHKLAFTLLTKGWGAAAGPHLSPTGISTGSSLLVSLLCI